MSFNNLIAENKRKRNKNKEVKIDVDDHIGCIEIIDRDLDIEICHKHANRQEDNVEANPVKTIRKTYNNEGTAVHMQSNEAVAVNTFDYAIMLLKDAIFKYMGESMKYTISIDGRPDDASGVPPSIMINWEPQTINEVVPGCICWYPFAVKAGLLDGANAAYYVSRRDALGAVFLSTMFAHLSIDVTDMYSISVGYRDYTAASTSSTSSADGFRIMHGLSLNAAAEMHLKYVVRLVTGYDVEVRLVQQGYTTSSPHIYNYYIVDWPSTAFDGYEQYATDARLNWLPFFIGPNKDTNVWNSRATLNSMIANPAVITVSKIFELLWQGSPYPPTDYYAFIHNRILVGRNGTIGYRDWTLSSSKLNVMDITTKVTAVNDKVQNVSNSNTKISESNEIIKTNVVESQVVLRSIDTHVQQSSAHLALIKTAIDTNRGAVMEVKDEINALKTSITQEFATNVSKLTELHTIMNTVKEEVAGISTILGASMTDSHYNVKVGNSDAIGVRTVDPVSISDGSMTVANVSGVPFNVVIKEETLNDLVMNKIANKCTEKVMCSNVTSIGQIHYL